MGVYYIMLLNQFQGHVSVPLLSVVYKTLQSKYVIRSFKSGQSEIPKTVYRIYCLGPLNVFLKACNNYTLYGIIYVSNVNRFPRRPFLYG